MFRLAVEPTRWTGVTAPLSACSAFSEVQRRNLAASNDLGACARLPGWRVLLVDKISAFLLLPSFYLPWVGRAQLLATPHAARSCRGGYAAHSP